MVLTQLSNCRSGRPENVDGWNPVGSKTRQLHNQPRQRNNIKTKHTVDIKRNRLHSRFPQQWRYNHLMGKRWLNQERIWSSSTKADSVIRVLKGPTTESIAGNKYTLNPLTPSSNKMKDRLQWPYFQIRHWETQYLSTKPRIQRSTAPGKHMTHRLVLQEYQIQRLRSNIPMWWRNPIALYQKINQSRCKFSEQKKIAA